jgi:murein DD-endopeptidase MepM/ murein hydrolase activator NlpD
MKNKNAQRISMLLIILLGISVHALFSHDLLVFASEQTDVNNDGGEKKDDLQDEYAENAKKIEKTKDILNLKKKEREIINVQIKKLESETMQVKEEIKENEEEIENLAQEIERIKSEVAQKEGHIALQKKVLEKFLREKYQNYSPNTEYFTVLNIANINKHSHRDALSQASNEIGKFIKKIHNEQEELKKDQVTFEKKVTRIEDAKYELEQRNAYLKSSQDYKRVLAAEVAVEENKYQEKLSKLEKEQLEIQLEISRLSLDYIGNFSLKDLPDADDVDFDLPVKKPYVRTQNYGKTTFSHNYSTGTHNGIDFVAQGSQSIIAAGDGKVTATGNMGRYGYGKWVAIDHKNGLVTLYGHLSSVSVSKGDKVDQGDTLGKMGNTGFSTGPHVHFSVFAEKTFDVIESSSVSGVYIPTGATVNPDIYL